MEKLKSAQDLIKTSSPSIASGFNMFIYGHDVPVHSEYYDYYERYQGFSFAKKMAERGEIAFTHKFRCKCGGHPFQYGGFWVCNSCGGKDVNEDWWRIRVEKDGNEYCCHGLDFIDIQESDNYAFGKTFSESIKKYGELFIDINAL